MDEVKSLNEINLELKKQKVFDGQTQDIKTYSQKAVDINTLQRFRQYVKAQFFSANASRSDNFLFNAYLNCAPLRGDFFNIENVLYEVVSVTRQLYVANDEGTFVKERAVTVIVDQKRSFGSRYRKEQAAGPRSSPVLQG
jgi:hypothetical protein